MESKTNLLGKYPVFTIFLSLVSAGIGCFWSMAAQEFYRNGMEIFNFSNGVERPVWFGVVYGLIVGFLIGRFFVYRLEKLLKRQNSYFIIGFGTLWGIGLGILCSCIVHILLMVSYFNLNFGPMFIGSFFGAFSGLVLGFLGSCIFIIIYSRKNKDEK